MQIKMPDYPRFTLSGQYREGNPIDPVNSTSDTYGNVEIRGSGWFHRYELTVIEPTLTEKLWFKYKCAYVTNSGVLSKSPSYQKGDPCPFPDGANISHICAIQIIALEGERATDYIFSFGGVVSSRLQEDLQPGMWLGQADGSAGDKVSAVTVQLRRN